MTVADAYNAWQILVDKAGIVFHLES
jgi:hypothetical protein